MSIRRSTRSSISLIMVVVLLLGSISSTWGGGIVQAAISNLVANPGFESGVLAPWEEGAAKFTVTNTTYHSGAYALQINGDSTYPFIRQLPLTVESHTEYVLSFYAKTTSSSTLIEYRTASADSANTPLKVETKSNPTTDWTLHTLRFNSGNMTQIRVVLKATGLAYIDDIELKKVASPKVVNVTISGQAKAGQLLTGHYTFESEGNTEGASTYRWLHADSADGIYTPIPGAEENKLVLTASEVGKYIKFEVEPVDSLGIKGAAVQSVPTDKVDGLIVNGGMETGSLAPWSVSDTAKVTVTKATYHSGNYSMKIAGDSGYPFARQMPITVDKNTDYIVSFYAKAEEAGTSIEYRTATADAANTPLNLQTKDNVSTSWTLYELPFNSGNHAEIRTVAKATKAVYFDDFTLRKAGDKNYHTVSVSDPNIKYYGRWDKRDSSTFKTSWAGTYFKVNFTGTSLRMILGGTSNIYVRIDGQETFYEAVNGVVNLTPVPLQQGTHTLLVASPYTDQTLQFQGLILDENAVTSAPQVGSKIIEFAGASIIAGHLLEKRGLSDYAWLAPEMLGYEHTQIAQSGMSLIDNWSGGSYISNKAGLSKQYFKMKHADSGDDTEWDFSTYTADAVVINVGTNDATFQVPAETYLATYITFLENIRDKYPNADIYAQRLFNGEFAEQTLTAVQLRRAAGDTKVHYIDTTGWLNSSDFIDGTHPTVEAHRKLAGKMAEILGLDNNVKASQVSISGTSEIGNSLKGSYVYENLNGDAEGGTTFRWLLSNTVDGIYTPIAGAVEQTLAIRRMHANSFVKFEVTPKDITGKTGVPAVSEAVQVLAGGAIPESLFTTYITAQGDQLMDGTKAFRFASLNYPGGMTDSEFSQEDAIRTIAEMGGNVTRTYVPAVKRYDNVNAAEAFVLGPDANGNMQFNEAGFRQLDNLLALANQYGVRVIIPFVDQWQWVGGIESYVNFRFPGTISNDAANDLDAWKFYTDPTVISDFKQVIRYMMNRVNTITGEKYKEDKAILAWETGNELGGYQQQQFPQAWTTEIARFIKEEMKPKQLLLDGRFAVHPDSLYDDNIDMVGNHFYTGNFIDKINADAELTTGKKPYILGEFGLYTTSEPVNDLFDAALKNGTDGIMLWSLRPHKPDGGFFWHDENPGNWASYHWPGFSAGEYYDEKAIIRTVYQYAHYMGTNDVSKITSVPPIKAPANAPVLFDINSVADIKWRGSVGAAGYEVQRSLDGQVWETVATDFSDGGRPGTPVFHDLTAITGQSYSYRVRGVNEAGHSEWSNVASTIAVHVITDELSLLYNDHEKRKIYAYNHSSNVQTKTSVFNELGIGYRAYVSTSQSGFITYASPVPLNKISLISTGSGTVKWYVSATNDHYQEIQPIITGNTITAAELPPNTRFVKFIIPGNNAVQIDKVQLEYTYSGTGLSTVPELKRNGFVMDTSFTDLPSTKSANLQRMDGQSVTEGHATLRRTDTKGSDLIYNTFGDINSYRVTSYSNSVEDISFYTSIDGLDYVKVNPAVVRMPISDGWSKVVYHDFGLPASTRYIKVVYPAGGNASAPAISQVEIGYGNSMIPITDKPPANLLENGEYDYGLDDNIQARYTKDTAGDNIALSLVPLYSLDPVSRKRGSNSIRLSYSLNSSYFAGLTRAMDGVDLSSYDALHAWVKSDGSGNSLIFQLKTSDGRVWEARKIMADTKAETIEIKTTDFIQPDSNISVVGKGTINLSQVEAFGIYVSGNKKGSGVVELDNVVLTNASKVDDFEGYGGYDALLKKAFVRNPGGGVFDISLSSTNNGESDYGLKVDYDFSGPGYAGGSFTPDFLNLKDYDGFTFWFKPDGSNNELAIQFTDSGDKYWETKIVYEGTDARIMYIPFDAFRLPSWYSSDTTARFDPNLNITAFSLYIGGSSQSNSSSGTLYFDDIHGTKLVSTVLVSDVSLTKSVTSLKIGDSEQLVATVAPVDATNKKVSWSSSNRDVASVNANGLVTGIRAGSATITVTTEDGSKTAAIIVTVNEASKPQPSTDSTPEPSNDLTSTPEAKPASPLEQSVIVNKNMITVKRDADENGVVNVKLEESDMRAALKNEDSDAVTISVNPNSDAKEVKVEVPISNILENALTSMIIDTGLASIEVEPTLFRKNDGTSARHLQLSVAVIDHASLPSDVQEKLSGSIVYDFKLSLDGSRLSQFNGDQVRVMIPYSIKQGEHQHKIVIYYVDDAGQLVVVKNGKYNTATGKVEFQAKHFSKYAAVYEKVLFIDLSQTEWAMESIEMLTARGVILGEGDGRFNPDGEITRAAFITMLMRATDLIDATEVSTFADVQHDSWYGSAIATAQKLGIVEGKYDANFGVNDPITREEMAVMMDRLVQFVQLETINERNSIAFNDHNLISDYARDAVTRVQKAGILVGLPDGNFMPKGQATRAQAAVAIYRLFTSLT